jgi:hypothetical protein
MKVKDNRYSYPLKLDKNLKEPIKKIAKNNRRKINDELNIAVKLYIEYNKKTDEQ